MTGLLVPLCAALLDGLLEAISDAEGASVPEIGEDDDDTDGVSMEGMELVPAPASPGVTININVTGGTCCHVRGVKENGDDAK